MNNEIEDKTYIPLTPFKGWVLENFPFIEANFDAITNYELMCKVIEYLNNVISNQNQVQELGTELVNAYNDLVTYVNNYFDNLNVQEEINNKLDSMVLDGSFAELVDPIINIYVQSAMDNTVTPTLTSFSGRLDNQDVIIEEQNEEINTFKNSVNSQIAEQNVLIQAATSGSPLIASSTDEMTDTTRVYVNTSDGKWYYYDGDSWEIGGTYQASSESTNVNDLSDTTSTTFESGVVSKNLTRIMGNVETPTDTNIAAATTQIAGAAASQAYTNNYTFSRNAYIKSIRLNDSTTTTTFSIFICKNNEVKASYISLTPTISNHVATLSSPIYIEKGCQVFIRHENGNYYMYRSAGNDYYEYRPGSDAFVATPYKAGFDLIYTNVSYLYNNGKYILTDFKTPKLEINKVGNYNYFAGTANNSITLIGRWFDKTINGVTKKCCNADGSSFIFRTNGISIVYVLLNTITTPTKTPYYAYSIDGSAFTRTKITNNGIVLPDDSEHIVWVVIDGMGENDPVGGGKWSGSVGIYIDGFSAECSAVNPKNRNIMFLGDSITEGINVLGTGADADVNSATNSYAFKTARKLNSIPLMCGYGGTGILPNASFHKAIEALQYNMQGVPINEQKPDIIVINHGYNDYNLIYTLHTYTEQQFIDGYKALIEKINVIYPGIPIICVVPFADVMKTQIETAIEDYSNCYLVDTVDYNPTTSDSVHLNQAGAEKVASLLANDIELIMNKYYFMN